MLFRSLFRMARCVGNRDRTSLRGAIQRKSAQTSGVNYRIKVIQPRLERNFLDGPVRETASTLVVSQKRKMPRKRLQRRPADWIRPFVFEIAQPVGRSHQWRPRACCSVCEPYAIVRGTEANLLTLCSHFTRVAPVTPNPASRASTMACARFSTPNLSNTRVM